MPVMDFFEKFASEFKPSKPKLIMEPPVNSLNRWLCTPKYDGQRLIAVRNGGEWRGFSRNMQEKTIPSEILRYLHWPLESRHHMIANPSMNSPDLLDGELVKEGESYLFYLFYAQYALTGNARDLTATFLLPRPSVPPSDHPIRSLNQTGPERAYEDGLEGVVFYDNSSPGPPKNWLKLKFRHTVDCIVYNKWRKGKTAVSLALIEDGDLVDVGGLSVPEPILDRLQVGDVVEVDFFRLTSNRKLYHASFQRWRTDKDPHECTFDQIPERLIQK
jgi:ATP-dependent DNA ligase